MMFEILATSFAAMVACLLLTPLVIRWATKKGVCDYPSSRRVHSSCIPRAGGIALFVSFLLVYIPSLLYFSKYLAFDSNIHKQYFFLAGAGVIFFVGLIDDIKQLPPLAKLIVQVVAALLAWYGGVNVELLSVTLYKGVALPWFWSLCITVGWVVLLINAINLIDGLDGLAAGICLFVAIILLSLGGSHGTPMLVFGLSSLAGACLGFLRYNFNPASIFMGDCGSYFLGYTLAVLTIEGAMKSYATVALLIPIIALGVPLLDTLFAPIRRFVLGKDLFQPDQKHFHHVLLKLGYSQRRAVLIIYGVTISLGLTSLAFVYVKDPRAAYVLVIPGALFFLSVKKLGYMEYIAADKVWGWLRDLTDEAGLSNERRSFLNLQMQILRAENLDELWDSICIAVEKLDFDLAQLHCYEQTLPGHNCTNREWRRPVDQEIDLSQQGQFKLEMPLMGTHVDSYGLLWLIKDLNRSNMSHYTLRRVEHLRRTIIGVLDRFASS